MDFLFLSLVCCKNYEDSRDGQCQPLIYGVWIHVDVFMAILYREICAAEFLFTSIHNQTLSNWTWLLKQYISLADANTFL